MIQLAYALSALPGWHTTRYNPAAANDDRGPGLNISWPGHNAAAWPDVSSTPTESELLQEGEHCIHELSVWQSFAAHGAW